MKLTQLTPKPPKAPARDIERARLAVATAEARVEDERARYDRAEQATVDAMGSGDEARSSAALDEQHQAAERLRNAQAALRAAREQLSRAQANEAALEEQRRWSEVRAATDAMTAAVRDLAGALDQAAAAVRAFDVANRAMRAALPRSLEWQPALWLSLDPAVKKYLAARCSLFAGALVPEATPVEVLAARNTLLEEHRAALQAVYGPSSPTDAA